MSDTVQGQERARVSEGDKAVATDSQHGANTELFVPLPLNSSRAVALSYSNQEELPRIVATGSGTLAQKIVEIALRSGVPVQENQELVALLGGLLPGTPITPESFRLVAEVVSFLYHVDRGDVTASTAVPAGTSPGADKALEGNVKTARK